MSVDRKKYHRSKYIDHSHARVAIRANNASPNVPVSLICTERLCFICIVIYKCHLYVGVDYVREVCTRSEMSQYWNRFELTCSFEPAIKTTQQQRLQWEGAKSLKSGRETFIWQHNVKANFNL